MSILLPQAQEEILYPALSYPRMEILPTKEGFVLNYKFVKFEDVLLGNHHITQESINIQTDSETNDIFFHINLILNEKIRNLFESLKNQNNFEFKKDYGEESYEYMIMMEVFKQFQNLLVFGNEQVFENLKDTILSIDEKYFVLNNIIKKTNNIEF